MQKLDCYLFITMRKGTKLQVLTVISFKSFTAVLAFIPLRMVQLLDFIVRISALSNYTVSFVGTFKMAIIYLAMIPTPISIPMIKPTACIFTII